jgi:serine/threonine protein kinase/WD40 repeat protein
MTPSEEQPGRDERVDEVIADYLDALAAGKKPDRLAILARHADLADELSAFFRDQDRLAAAAGLLGEPNTPPENVATGSLPVDWSQGTGKLPVLRQWGSVLGDYELLHEIARGGMGVVYRARQVSLDRIVAVKLILAGPFAAPEDRQRFRAEALATAALDHPNIVPIYEVGEHSGQLYFSMKLIEGGNLSSRIGSFAGDPKSFARLLATVARAVHFAHARGILHRDLKPANVLIDGDRQPHVTDFGLAKRLTSENAAHPTTTGAILGTPAYMAPEQAAARKDLTTAADVYSLGAILYEMLTGKPPFHADTPLDTLLQVVDKEPVAPSARKPGIDRDLETICLKCLRKSPPARYESAAALADDLDRWLAGAPIQARPVTRRERLRKWVTRNPAVAALSAAAILLLVVGSAVSTWFAVDASRHAREADQRAAESRHRLARNCVFNGNRLLESRDWSGALVWYVEALKLEADVPERADLHRRRVKLTLDRLPGLTHLWRLPAGEQFSTGNGKHLITMDRAGAVRIRSATTGTALSEPLRLASPIAAVTLSGDGRRVATVAGRQARLWEAPSGRPLGPVIELPLPAVGVTLAHDGRQMVVPMQKKGKEPYTWTIELAYWSEKSGALARPLVPPMRWCACEFSPDGKRLLFEEIEPVGHGTFKAYIRVYDVSTWNMVFGVIESGVVIARESLLRGILDQSQKVVATSSAFVRGGRRIFTAPGRGGGGDLHSTIRAIAEGDAKHAALPVHHLAERAVSPDGNRVALIGADGLRTWEHQHGGSWVASWDQPTQEAESSPTFSPDSALIATIAGKEGEIVRLRNARDKFVLFPALHHPQPVLSLHFAADGRRLLTVDQIGVVRTWDLAGDGPSTVSAGDLGPLAFSGDHTRFAAWRGNTLQLHDSRTGKALTGRLDHGAVLRGWFPIPGQAAD